MKSLLKFITCGSVDDGKSTLIGHMLYDAKLLFADQEKALQLESKLGNCDGKLDYSLLLDGLMAEREQGITIDVAYRYFTTENRSFIVADTPGHEEYTRNMAVGASFAHLAVILVDASKGVVAQTKRHTRICALMGIKHIVLAINKMDLIEYDQHRFNEIKNDFLKTVSEFDLESICVIPLSAVNGDNITTKSPNTLWYHGQTLLSYLEEIDIASNDDPELFVMPIQRVCRPNHTFRGFQGQIESGIISKGDEITAFPSGEKGIVKSLYITNRQTDKAQQGQSITLQLDREMDVSRGCVLARGYRPEVADLFTATLLWMDNNSLVAGRNYLLKIGTKTIPATVLKLKYRIDINDGQHIPTDRVFKNEMAVCDIAVSESITFDAFSKCQALGELILIDRLSNMTAACGVVDHLLTRSKNLTWQEYSITRDIRAEQKQQNPITLWFTGLSGSGKSTLSNAVEKRLLAMNKHTMLLDGDNIRHGLCRNLGFKENERVENIRRVAEVAKLMNDAGLIVLTAFISPYENDRQNARDIIGCEQYFEIYISTPLEVCEQRDVKGLYKKARDGQIQNFTGISNPYEAPLNPSMILDTSKISLDDAVQMIIDKIIYNI